MHKTDLNNCNQGINWFVHIKILKSIEKAVKVLNQLKKPDSEVSKDIKFSSEIVSGEKNP